jgi:hypothetical protein
VTKLWTLAAGTVVALALGNIPAVAQDHNHHHPAPAATPAPMVTPAPAVAGQPTVVGQPSLVPYSVAQPAYPTVTRFPQPPVFGTVAYSPVSPAVVSVASAAVPVGAAPVPAACCKPAASCCKGGSCK